MSEEITPVETEEIKPEETTELNEAPPQAPSEPVAQVSYKELLNKSAGSAAFLVGAILFTIANIAGFFISLLASSTLSSFLSSYLSLDVSFLPIILNAGLYAGLFMTLLIVFGMLLTYIGGKSKEPAGKVRAGLVFYKIHLIISLILSCFMILGILLVSTIFFNAGSCVASINPYDEMLSMGISFGDDVNNFLQTGMGEFSVILTITGAVISLIAVVGIILIISYYRTIFTIIKTIKTNSKADDYKPIKGVVKFMVYTILLIIASIVISIPLGLLSMFSTIVSSAGILTCVIVLKIHQKKILTAVCVTGDTMLPRESSVGVVGLEPTASSPPD